MTSFIPEKANMLIDDFIVTPLLAKENEEANNITETYKYKYDPESNMTITTLETSMQSEFGQYNSDGNVTKTYGDNEKPRSCCQRLKSAFLILLALGNISAWIVSFFHKFGSSWHSILIYISGSICLVTTLLLIVNEKRILSYPANLIEMVSGIQSYKRELKQQVNSLTEEAQYLRQRATRYESAAIQLREKAESEGYHADKLLQMVKNNEKVLDLMREKQREKVTEEVVRIILKDGSPIINEATAKSLASDISVKLAELNVELDKEKFIQALASNPTLLGALSTVKELLPDEEDSLKKDNLFFLSDHDQTSKGSVYAARAKLDGKQVPLAQRLKQQRSTYPGTGGANDNAADDEDPERPKNAVREALRQFMIMAMPYFRENRQARCLFATLLIITLVNNALNVYFSYLMRDFYNALTEKHVSQFYKVFVRYVGSLIIAVPIQVSYRYLYTKIGIAWRKWLTERVLTLYFSNRVFYGLEAQGNNADREARNYKERQNEVDNPDQRIQEDVSSFTSYSLSFFLRILSTTINLVSFSIILFSVMPKLFIAIIVFATLGTATTIVIGKVLIRLNYEAIQREADFRFSLVRIRENVESIAFYGGESVEEKETKNKFQRVIDNSNLINNAERNLDVFIISYNHLTEILPSIILANQFFNGIIEYGVISQVRGAFYHLLNDFSIIIKEFNSIASFAAGLDRLFLFMKAIQKLDSHRPKDDRMVMMKDLSPPSDEDDSKTSSDYAISVKEKRISDAITTSPTDTQPSTILSMNSVRLMTPDNKRVLVENLDMSLLRGKNLLIAGVSGSGKSSLLRAIAGLWSNGSGEIVRPSSDQVYFLPQRVYCPPGSLRDQLLYPSTQLSEDYDGAVDGWSTPIDQRRVEWSSMSDQELLEVLDMVDLPHLAKRIGDGDARRGLHTVLDYSNTLSLGEQQRLAFGRVIINRPSLVICDESTSSLDVVTERKMYTLLKNIASSSEDGEKSLTYVSVGHRPTLLQHHDVKLLLKDGGGSVSFISQTEISTEEEAILA